MFDEQIETLGSSYKTLHREIQKLFIENWNEIREFSASSIPQEGKGSFHCSEGSKIIKNTIGPQLWHEPICKLKGKLKNMSLV